MTYQALRFRIFKFNKEDNVTENDKFIFVGWAEAFPFAISKQTGEIVENRLGYSRLYSKLFWQKTRKLFWKF